MAVQKNLNQPKTIEPSLIGQIVWYGSFIFIVPIFCHVHNKNLLRRMETKVDEADSGIDVQLAKRRDLLVKLVQTAKQAMEFEKATLSEVTKLRRQDIGSLTTKQKSEFNSEMDQALHNINVQMEAYPNLRATENILQLQQAISDAEEDVAAARRIYNANVSMYNQTIQSYPASVAAKGLTTREFFEATDRQKDDLDDDLFGTGFKRAEDKKEKDL